MRARRKSRSKLGVYSISIPVSEDGHDHVLRNAFFRQALLDRPYEGGVLGFFRGVHVFVHGELDLDVFFQADGLTRFEDSMPEACLDPSAHHDLPPCVRLHHRTTTHANRGVPDIQKAIEVRCYRDATGMREGASGASGTSGPGWNRRASGCTGFFVNMKMNAPKEAMSASAANPIV